jgi:hypothetical protein
MPKELLTLFLPVVIARHTADSGKQRTLQKKKPVQFSTGFVCGLVRIAL